MSPHKLGVIGAGAFTDFALQGYKEHLDTLELTAITDPKLELAKSLAAKYGIKKVYASNEELFQDESISIVLILTPPNTHFVLAKQALEHDKHVLVEKPIAFKEDDALELINLADAKSRQLSANLVLRHHPFHRKIADYVQNGSLGKLERIESVAKLAAYPVGHWYWDAKISGGFFLNTFCHFLDLYDFIFGLSPGSLESSGSTDKVVTIKSTYPDGQSATLQADIHVKNEDEFVETVYFFEKAVIKTRGWLPEEMAIEQDGALKTWRNDEKLPLYRQLLAEIMEELLRRVDNPAVKTLITHQALLQAVKSPTRAEHNWLS
ncbi:MAG: Gfo/Idh/MocA family oxidoreductase [Candidatus Berkelbacteria bacterium]|nr:MAG: Gfo/Idh/MocA family oxidoreductase [Candidatus Berkelbacteria bacterium]QQG51918.1 MAG: Gfo/Idh/MocA family oxidoreductase [Candidatus Berkelbacteria bacterium]